MKNFVYNLFSICLVIGVGSQLAQAADEDLSWAIGTGVDYSSGDYGDTSDTSILFIPVTGRVEYGRLTVKASVPYIRIEGPGNVVGGTDGGIVVGPGGGGKTSQSGLGDIVVSGSYLFYPLSEGMPFMELTGKVKIPTADEDKGLGTGKVDYTIQGDLYQPFGAFTIFGGIGYRVRGEPAGFNLGNSFLASVGGAYKVSDIWSGGLMFDYREAATKTSDDRLELTPYVAIKPSTEWTLSLYASFGMSDASADTGGGLSVRRNF